MDRRYHLFEVIGIELEYMIVDCDTLDVRPLADTLIYDVVGSYTADVEVGAIAWSNELVNHVIELKTNGPVASLVGISEQFHHNVLAINKRLDKWNAMLLPTGVHPLMDPYTQTVIWPHEHNPVYELYNRIFDCRGHGWANLQSTHINLPFANDEEFGRLHAAIRLLLPIIPALSASSPIIDGQPAGFLDMRLEAYRHNQDRLPVIVGDVIPEAVFTRTDYETQIFSPINEAIAPFDTEHLLQRYFLNSRGAIARFDRGAIEIRIIDIQEAPVMDMAIVELIVAALRWLVDERGPALLAQMKVPTSVLKNIFLQVIQLGGNIPLNFTPYQDWWGNISATITPNKIWRLLYEAIKPRLQPASQEAIEIILDVGSLSERILVAVGSDLRMANIHQTYHRLAECLKANKPFLP